MLMAAAPAWPADAFVVASIVLSAGTYLFDFGSNIVVLVQCSTRFMRLSQREKEGILSCNGECPHQKSDVTGYFYCLLAILICCHSLNALLFKLKFTHRSEAPLFAAYFLPLIHLYRLSHLLWRTLSCKGIQDLRSPEMNGLYCILGSAMEGVPMLVLQFAGYLVLTRDGLFSHSMSTTFKVSVAASLLSAAYNGGTSVQSIAKNATTLKQKLGAGAMGAGFTLSATVVRCLTYTYIIVHIHEYFFQRRKVLEREQAKFNAYDAIILLVIAGIIVVYTLYFWLMHSPRHFSKSLRDPRCLLTALAFSYMSTYLGPLYPLISQANDANQLGSYIFRLKLLALSLVHLCLDLAVLCVTNRLGTLARPYLIVSSLTAVGYMVFLIAYIKFDKSCGPTTSSNESILPEAHSDDDDNGHKLILLSELRITTNTQPRDMEKPQAEAVSQHVNPSSDQSTHLTRSQKTEDMACIVGGPFPSENYISAHPPLVWSHDVDLPEDKGCTPLINSTLSLDRHMKFTNKRDRSSIAAWSSFDSSPTAYSGYPLN